MLAGMEERDRKAPLGKEDTSRRVEALESGLQNVRSRLDGLERSNRAIESDVRTMKDQINSMQSSIQEMLMIFRNLSDKLKQKAEGDASHFSAGPQASEARLGKEDLDRLHRSSGTGSRTTTDGTGGRRERAGEGDELVKDPRHLREDEDEGA
jgi:chromosome segregation ATPase